MLDQLCIAGIASVRVYAVLRSDSSVLSGGCAISSPEPACVSNTSCCSTCQNWCPSVHGFAYHQKAWPTGSVVSGIHSQRFYHHSEGRFLHNNIYATRSKPQAAVLIGRRGAEGAGGLASLAMVGVRGERGNIYIYICVHVRVPRELGGYRWVMFVYMCVCGGWTSNCVLHGG